MAQSQHRARAGPSPTHGGIRDRHAHPGFDLCDRNHSRRGATHSRRARGVRPFLHPSRSSPRRASRRHHPRLPPPGRCRAAAWRREKLGATLSWREGGGVHCNRRRGDTTYIKNRSLGSKVSCSPWSRSAMGLELANQHVEVEVVARCCRCSSMVTLRRDHRSRNPVGLRKHLLMLNRYRAGSAAVVRRPSCRAGSSPSRRAVTGNGLEILGHLRERAVLVLTEPRAHCLESGAEVDGLHVAVPHRSPPGTARPPTPDSTARSSMADASSLSRTDLVDPVHR
jgi:hypothetical protein